MKSSSLFDLITKEFCLKKTAIFFCHYVYQTLLMYYNYCTIHLSLIFKLKTQILCNDHHQCVDNINLVKQNCL